MSSIQEQEPGGFSRSSSSFFCFSESTTSARLPLRRSGVQLGPDHGPTEGPGPGPGPVLDLGWAGLSGADPGGDRSRSDSDRDPELVLNKTRTHPESCPFMELWTSSSCLSGERTQLIGSL